MGADPQAAWRAVDVVTWGCGRDLSSGLVGLRERAVLTGSTERGCGQARGAGHGRGFGEAGHAGRGLAEPPGGMEVPGGCVDSPKPPAETGGD